jgi:hypothetical protein
MDENRYDFAHFGGGHVLMWTDPDRGLNEMKLADTLSEIVNPPSGVHHKIDPELHRLRKTGLEGESSIGQPALADFNGRLFVAWTGTDGAGHLNVMSSADGLTWDQNRKQTLGETSVAGPALVAFDNKLFIGWTGTDGDRTPNVAYSSDGRTFGKAFPLSAQHSIDGSPSLAVAQTLASPVRRVLYLGWTERGSNSVRFAPCYENGNFMNVQPDHFFFGRNEQDIKSEVPVSLHGGFGLTAVWIDNERHMRMSSWDLSDLGSGGSWSDPIVYADATDRPPALIGGNTMSDVEMAWRGLDGKHHLNVSESNQMPTV